MTRSAAGMTAMTPGCSRAPRHSVARLVRQSRHLFTRDITRDHHKSDRLEIILFIDYCDPYRFPTPSPFGSGSGSPGTRYPSLRATSGATTGGSNVPVII